MSLAQVRCRTTVGVDSHAVDVETHIGNGLPAFHIVGLPAAAVRESRERVRAALLHAGFEFPNRRITVNLTPADLPKDSGGFDLPIAIGVLVASGQLTGPDGRKPPDLDATELVGELSLTGKLRPVKGLLAIALGLMRDAPVRELIIPAADAAQAAVVPGLRAVAAGHLTTVCAHLDGSEPLAAIEPEPPAPADERTNGADFADVRGQAIARRALEIAAAGRHSLLMSGPPGAGKSMLATRLPSILPPATGADALESAAILALTGRFRPDAIAARPFRAPHHSASTAALIGGGNPPRPGEASLAHHGVLFLDELPEFSRAALEALREPLETGAVVVSRAARQVTFPAAFRLVAAMNPCPCGHLGTPDCRCSADQVQRYQRRVSGPLLDRIDLRITLARVDEQVLLGARPAESSSAIAQRVATATERQLARQGCPNALLDVAGVDRWCRPDADGHELLMRAAAGLRLSARALHRVQKVARTIADLAAREDLQAQDVREALGYRQGPNVVS
ncbi:MAG: YifB family Mg chelatase-like AAA ATPase [Burkholderiaceae bacterium]